MENEKKVENVEEDGEEGDDYSHNVLLHKIMLFHKKYIFFTKGYSERSRRGCGLNPNRGKGDTKKPSKGLLFHQIRKWCHYSKDYSAYFKIATTPKQGASA